ncbi:hypothetical protein RRG08_028746 [Elysia crispata]|uniref:Uncharacterized protein n=1 Tax=Elysia crispata TaxID=231223 RepID=A0AAE1DJM6_9GAST|nr:hypothetical protein RRG08_028746 [Elysia crispata]
MQSSVVVKENGAHPPPDRLRLRIVEMAEKRSRTGSGNMSAKSFSNSRQLNQPDINVHHIGLKKGEREIKGEVFRPPIIARVGRSRERINLELPKTPKPRQDQQQLSLYDRVVVLDGGNHRNGNAKDKASAWLLKRFRQRRFPNVDDKTENGNSNQAVVEAILPSQFRPMAAEPTKRFRTLSGTVREKATPVEFPHHVRISCLSKTPEEEADTISVTPTTHFPSNDSADVKKQSRPGPNEFPNERFFDQTDTFGKRQESKGSLIARDKQENRLCGLRGNALTTPPPRQNSTRKPGLFSASLEAFRRRLKLTASKYTERLNNENVDRTEDYVIRAEPRVHTAALTRSPTQTPNHSLKTPPLLPRSNISQHRPSSEIRPIDPKLRQPYLQSSWENDDDKCNNISKKEIYTLISNNEETDTINKNHTTDKIGNNISNKYNITSSNHFKDVNSKEEGRRNVNPANSKTNVDSNNSQKAHNHVVATKEFHPDTEEADITSDTFPCIISSKEPVPKVKTYVVMDSPSGKARNQPSTTAEPQPPPRRVVPLTEHNMRLHESLQAMFERRAQRVARYQKRQRANNQQHHCHELKGQQQATELQKNPPIQHRQLMQQHYQQQRIKQQLDKEQVSGYDSDTSEESISVSRIRKWVIDVTEKRALQVHAGNTETCDLTLNYVAESEIAVEGAIPFENALNKQGVVCC